MNWRKKFKVDQDIVFATVMGPICNPDILQTDHKLCKTDIPKIFKKF